MFTRTLLVCGISVFAIRIAHAEEALNYYNLSFSGDGESLSGSQLLEASILATSTASFAADASEKGDLSYGIPITVPAALLGPSVGLNFSGGAGEHSWVARGWSVGHGQVSIQKILGQEAVQAYAGVTEPHRISGAGLDGVLSQDPNGSWVYTSSGTTEGTFEYDSSTQSWIVNRGGLRTFLEPQGGADFSGVDPTEWFPVAVEDRSGNAMSLTWTGTRLDEITFGGHCSVLPQGGLVPCTPDTPHFMSVSFTYDQSVRLGASISYASGVADVRDAWMTEIEVRTGVASQNLLNTYVLEATSELLPPTGPDNGNSRGRLLERVKVLGWEIDPNSGAQVSRERTLATLTYEPWINHIDTGPGSIDGPQPRDLSERYTTRGQKLVVPDPITGFDDTTILPSEVEEKVGLWDFSGDGLLDLYWRGYVVWMERDEAEPLPKHGWFFEDPDVVGGRTTDFNGAVAPLVQTGFCRNDGSGRYGKELFIDLDGDGFTDSIRAVADAQMASGLGENYCDDNAEPATSTWDVRYGKRDGFELPESLVAPYKFPSIGQVQYGATPEGYLDDREWIISVERRRGAELIDGSVELMDMDGDGWLDVVAVGLDSIEVYLKEPGRTTGWQDPEQWWTLGLTGDVLGHSVTVQYNQLVEESLGGVTYHTGYPLESYAMRGFRDLNGDGLVDYVVACEQTEPLNLEESYWWCGADEHGSSPQVDGSAPANWTVWYNTRAGFDGPHPWGIQPGIIAMSRVDEGKVGTLACQFAQLEFQNDPIGLWADLASGGDTSGTLTLQSSCTNIHFSDGGRGQRVEASMEDWDGDGRVDYVDLEEKVWYRNVGNGFSAGRTIADWYPDALSETWGTQSIITNGPPSTSNGDPQANPGGTRNWEAFRIMDLDRDGMLDVVYPNDYGLGSSPIPAGVEFGQYPRPGMLRAIEIETGAVTAINYRSSSYLYPAGQDVTEDQRMATRKDVLSQLNTWDPVTEQGATRKFDYESGVCEFGMCLGFENRVVQDYKRNASILAQLTDDHGGRGVLLSETETLYDLARDWAVPTGTKTRTDHNLVHLPGNTGTSALLNTRIETFTYAPNLNTFSSDEIEYRWLRKKDITQLAEGTGSRSWKIDVFHVASGHTSVVRHTVAGDPTARQEQKYTYVTSTDDTMVLPRQIRSLAYDPETGNTNSVVEWGCYGYDNEAIGTSPSDGILTSELVCGGEVGGFCTDPLEWTFGRTARGVVNHVEAHDGTYKFLENTINAFAWGDTVPIDEVNAMGHVTTRSVDDYGRVTSQIDANGVSSRSVLDSFGRATQSFRKGVGSPEHETSHTVFDDLIPQTVSSTIFDENGPVRTEHQVLDGFGGVAQSWRPNVNDTGFIVVDSLRDAMGNELRTSYPRTETTFNPGVPLTFELSGQLISAGSEFTVAAEYDAFGSVRWSVSDAAPLPTRATNPSPGVTLTTDGEGFRKELTTDTHGRIVRVREGRVGSTLVETGTYTYDGRARVLSFTDANSNEHRYVYDKIGRLNEVFRTPGSGGPEEPYYAYDYLGPHPHHMYQAGDLSSPIVQWTYDALGRTTFKTVKQELDPQNDSDPSTPYDATDAVYSWTWDTITDGAGTRTWNGVRHQVSDPAGKIQYFYDEAIPWGELGRLSSVERTNDAVGVPIVFGYDYDFEGRELTTTWPGGTKVDRMFTGSGWLDTAFISGQEPIDVAYDYDSMGLLAGTQMTRPTAGSGIDWQIDLQRSSPSRLDRVEHQDLLTGAIKGSANYSRYNNGWLKTRAIAPPHTLGDFLEYTYDDLGRVERVHKSGTPGHMYEHYSYDAAGHMTQFGEGFDPAGTFEHDWLYSLPSRFGEVPGRVDALAPTTEFDDQAWDSATSRLRQWESESTAGVVTRDFEYEATGRLIRITNNGVETELFYDVDDNLVYEERGMSTFQRFNGWREENDTQTMQLLDGIRATIEPGQPRMFKFALMDLDGRAPLVFDEDGQIASQEITGAYGAVIDEASWSAGSVWEIDDLHGSEIDRDNEVMHFGVRHTLWRDGMWMQPEPLLMYGRFAVDQPRSYGAIYSAGSPLVRSDVTGYEDGDVVVFFTGAVNSGPNCPESVCDGTKTIHNGTNPAPATDAIEADVTAQLDGEVTTAVVQPELLAGNQVENAVDFVKSNLGPEGKVAIYGYSRGGGVALDLNAALDAQGIPTAVIVTVDPIAPGLVLNNQVADNTGKAVNFKQSSSIPTGSTVSGNQAINIPVPGASHHSINGQTADAAAAIIVAALTRPE